MSMRFFLFSVMVFGVSAVLWSGAVLAKPQSTEPKLLGTFGDWSAYSFIENGKNVCYILSSPKKAVGNYKKRGEIFALVTNRPAEKSFDVFSVISGYEYKDDSTVTITIDKQKFVLFSHNDSAWAPDTATDKRLADAMRKGKTMLITGTSSKGTTTTDTYGLKGTGAAFEAMSAACSS
jgi:invasion protein IalB